jgi:16S rRNA (guanine966-N2)-methyltransferase
MLLKAMRIIAGISKGRRLNTTKNPKIRPALDAVREAIFNILGDLSDIKVLDLFAGTGSVGLEALSRGASEAVFIDQLPEAVRLIHKNLALCGFAEQAAVFKNTVAKAIPLLHKRGLQFDLIFVDPPYDRDLVNPALQQIAQEKILAPQGRIVVEHSPRETINKIGGLEISSRPYGQTLISFLHHE